MSDEEHPSPFDRFRGDTIAAGVSHDGRLLGYSVADDLARHYSFADVIYLLLTGTLPDTDAGRAFEVALLMATNVTIADASVHATRVARHTHWRMVNSPAVLATGGIAVAEHAAWVVKQHEPWLAWLDGDRTSPIPAVARDDDAVHSETLRSFGEMLDGSVVAGLVEHGPTLIALILALFRDCGLVEPHQLAAALVYARLPVAVAEGFSVEDPGLWEYPLNLPRFVYEPGDSE